MRYLTQGSATVVAFPHKPERQECGRVSGCGSSVNHRNREDSPPRALSHAYGSALAAGLPYASTQHIRGFQGEGRSALAGAQDFRATITGQVTDPSGAIIANASVKAVNQETGVPSEAKTNSDGHYTIPYLNPGT